MGFWSDLGDRLSGRSKQISYEAALKTQEEIARQVLEEEKQQNLLKYSPELSKQRTKQIAIVSISVAVIVIGIIIYIRYFK